MEYGIYAAQYGDVALTKDEAAIMECAHYLWQRPGSVNGHHKVLQRAKELECEFEVRAKNEWQRSRPAFFWLGVEADND